MGCGCSKGKRSVGRRPIATRQRGGLTNGTSPAQLRQQQQLQNNVSGLSANKTLSASGLSKRRREVEKKRRAAVLRALGRP